LQAANDEKAGQGLWTSERSVGCCFVSVVVLCFNVTKRWLFRAEQRNLLHTFNVALPAIVSILQNPFTIIFVAFTILVKNF